MRLISRRLTRTTRTAMVLLVLAMGLTGCDRQGGTGGGSPLAPTDSAPPAPLPQGALAVFKDGATGFSTSDVHDAQEQVVRFTNTHELIWVADDTRLAGYHVVADAPTEPAYRVTGKICPEGCDFDIRFGTKDGKPRAYLTVDYGHFNPGTVVDVEILGGQLVVTQTNAGPPGTSTLSGVVSELTPGGQSPVEGVLVQRTVLFRGGYQSGVTDVNGAYRIYGLYSGISRFSTFKDEFNTETRELSITRDSSADFRVVRR